MSLRFAKSEEGEREGGGTELLRDGCCCWCLVWFVLFCLVPKTKKKRGEKRGEFPDNGDAALGPKRLLLLDNVRTKGEGEDSRKSRQTAMPLLVVPPLPPTPPIPVWEEAVVSGTQEDSSCHAEMQECHGTPQKKIKKKIPEGGSWSEVARWSDGRIFQSWEDRQGWQWRGSVALAWAGLATYLPTYQPT